MCSSTSLGRCDAGGRVGSTSVCAKAECAVRTPGRGWGATAASPRSAAAAARRAAGGGERAEPAGSGPPGAVCRHSRHHLIWLSRLFSHQ